MIITKNSISFLIRQPKTPNNTKLIIFLHGYGSNEEDLFSFADEMPDNFLVLSLRAIRNCPYGNYAWYDINFINAEKFTDTEQAKESVLKIRNFIDEIKNEYSFDEQDIWLCGFSQGGILSYALAIQYPEIFKKAICLSAYPEKNIIQDIENNDYTQSKFFISHGKEDAVIPIEWARNAESIMKENRIDYFYKEYNSGHGINADNYRDLMLWIAKSN